MTDCPRCGEPNALGRCPRCHDGDNRGALDQIVERPDWAVYGSGENTGVTRTTEER